jgi:outer membrane beta-barrel protein
MRFIVLIVLLFSIESHAVKIQFPEDELASESVLPKFDNPDPVKNRNVVTAGRFELTGMLGWTLNDVFVDPLTFGAIATYHITEVHAFQFYGSKFSAKENEYPSQIQNETGVGIPKPSLPESAFLLAYQITPFYGKLSLTKQGVTNMSFYGTAGIGTYNVEGENNFAMSAGVGTKVYLTNRFSLRIDYRWFFFDAKDPIGQVDNPLGGPIEKDLGNRQQFNSILTVGAGFLF